MDRIIEFRRILNEMVDQDRSFPSDQDSHDAVHVLSIEIHQRAGMDMLNNLMSVAGDVGAMMRGATGVPVAVGCAMFRLGFQLGQTAGAEAVANAREQLETWDGATAPCTCARGARWWTGEHRPPRPDQNRPACPRWAPPDPRW